MLNRLVFSMYFFCIPKNILPLHSLFDSNTSLIKGEMVEWSITTVLKTVALRGAGGSNPSLSANRLQKDFTKVVNLAFKI